jgi:DNA invertase Pin-like site-specific DNA recombinase
MKIGYARVSTDEQITDLQTDALNRAGCEMIYTEHASGKNTDRPELKACLRSMREGDTLIVWRLDRLGRSLSDLITIVTSLEKLGVVFQSLNEQIDTSTPTGRFSFHLFSAMAEFERNINRERTNAGLKSARARGRVGGRPKKVSDNDKRMISALLADKANEPREIAKRFKISKSTMYRVAKEVSTATA